MFSNVWFIQRQIFCFDSVTVKYTPKSKPRWKFNQIIVICIQWIALENVFCKMAAILSRLQCVNEIWRNLAVHRHPWHTAHSNEISWKGIYHLSMQLLHRNLFRVVTLAIGSTVVYVLVWCLISSPPCVAYMHQWTVLALVQIMACGLFGAKPYQNTIIFIQENARENIVCETAAILSRGRLSNKPLLSSITTRMTSILQWNLSVTTTQWDTSLPSGAHLGGQGPPRWAPEGRNW